MCFALGTLSAGALRSANHIMVTQRSEVYWENRVQDEAETAATNTANSFSELCNDAQSLAKTLARETPIAMATEGSDAQDFLTETFQTLARFDYPSAHLTARSGATLYDVWQRPLAWTGNNVSLQDILESITGTPPPGVFIIRQGVYTYLVAVEPLVSQRGFVSIEIPLIAEYHLENRYLESFNALSTWAARPVEIQPLRSSHIGSNLPQKSVLNHNHTWVPSTGTRELSFPLLSHTSFILGTATTQATSTTKAKLNAHNTYISWGGLSLLATNLLALLFLFGKPSHWFLWILGVWSLRFVLFFADISLGLNLNLDSTEHYTSQLFWGLAQTPIDLFLTSAALLASVSLLSSEVIKRKLLDTGGPLRSRIARSISAVLVLSGVNGIIFVVWSNAHVALTPVSGLPPDLPRLLLHGALVLLFIASGLVGFLLLSSNQHHLKRNLYIDTLVILMVYTISTAVNLQTYVLLATPGFLAIQFIHYIHINFIDRRSLTKSHSSLITVSLLSVLIVPAFYLSTAFFEDRAVRSFVEKTLTPVVLKHKDSRLETIAETQRIVDALAEQEFIEITEDKDLAYELWTRTNLVNSSLSSSIEIVDELSSVVSRFALSFPLSNTNTTDFSPNNSWRLEEEHLPNDPNHPGILLARRTFTSRSHFQWEIRIRVAADWKNLPFIATNNPYLQLFRTADSEANPRVPDRELALFVIEPDGTSIFESSRGAIQVPDEILSHARRNPLWWVDSAAQMANRVYLFSSGQHIFGLSYPQPNLMGHLSNFAAWTVLGVIATFLYSLIGLLNRTRGMSITELWSNIAMSFSGKLYVGLLLISIIPFAILTFILRGLLIQQLQQEVEQDGVSTARVVERFVNDFVQLELANQDTLEPTVISDAVLERIGALTAVDIDLYFGGELVSTSKPELFESGLLQERIAPHVYRDLTLDKLTHSIHREALGSFEYLVVSIPIRVEAWQEPGLLALPLASQRHEINKQISSLNATLLFAALTFSIAAAILAYWFARRIGRPVNVLTEATQRIAQGDLDVSLKTNSQDEIGKLFKSFTKMTMDLKRQREDLERTKKLEAWAVMARQIAHEIKNPLTPIQLSTEHMLRVFKDPKIDFKSVLDDCSDTILKQVTTLREISKEFLTFGSPEQLKVELTDVGQLVRETSSPYSQTPPKGVTVTLNIHQGLTPIAIDRKLISRTLLNLIENSLHALRGDGELRIEVKSHSERVGQFILIDVSDTGEGIDPQIKDRLFEPYFSTRAAGTGLGLAIAKKVVEDHGGQILFKSHVGSGTTVSILLPVIRSNTLF